MLIKYFVVLVILVSCLSCYEHFAGFANYPQQDVWPNWRCILVNSNFFMGWMCRGEERGGEGRGGEGGFA